MSRSLPWRNSILSRRLSFPEPCRQTKRRIVIQHYFRHGTICIGSRRAVQRRGGKTKATIKVNELPQGALPPLPPAAVDDAPVPQYPTVLQQHLNNVLKFKDCIVLTRVGDFYEMYFDQVDQYAHLVNLKKAKRSTVLGDVAMAGFKHTQLDRYLKMFVQDLGKQVAISEQIRVSDEDRASRGMGGAMYDRKVTRIVTAGTLIDENFMDPYENNFLLGVWSEDVRPSAADVTSPTEKDAKASFLDAKIGLAWIDLSSGNCYTQAGDLASLPSIVARVRPREIVLEQKQEDANQSQIQKYLGEGDHSIHFHQVVTQHASLAQWNPMFQREVSAEFEAEFAQSELMATNLAMEYVREKLQDMKIQLQPPVRRSDDEYMAIDKQSLRGLEIRATLRDGAFQGSLLHTVRKTVTKSGARLLSERLVSPSMSLTVINNRLDLVQDLLLREDLRETIMVLLRQTSDTLRLLQRFSIGKGDSDDLIGLARTIEITSEISGLLHDQRSADEDTERKRSVLCDFLERLDLERPLRLAENIFQTIDEENLNRQHAIEDEHRAELEGLAEELKENGAASDHSQPSARRASKTRQSPITARDDVKEDELWIMRKNASPLLEKAHNDLQKLFDAKQQLVFRLRRELKAESLTLKWSAQLGHFCHVKAKDTKVDISALGNVRSISSTKTTRSFYFHEWSHLGFRIEEAILRIRTEEKRVFDALRQQAMENIMTLRRNAAVLDELDVACSSAVVAKNRDLVRPILNTGKSHQIVGGRHPTVDAGLNEQGRRFTSNDCSVGSDKSIYFITGPNMAGKSTYLRQNALITILAQTGLFVPADFAEIGLVDKVFSRIGSADNLYQDQSTFMIEMLETAEILKSATPRSFVIMDEVGRGTAPEDGIAVGYACLHHLHYVNKCRTLFASHFHVLADMTRDFERLGCQCTDIAEGADGSWAYVHKLRPGVNRESHALKVARMAGLPDSAIVVAREVLHSLRSSGSSSRSCIERPEARTVGTAAG